jgi:phosphoribosylaminoimidazolecarboxamide formyltransferase / IMP cyclohydrolase
MRKKIESALISVYHKDGLDELLQTLNRLGVKLYSTGGTWQHITSLGLSVEKVEDITGYPSVFGGRVKTLHPKVFGGILYRRDNESDRQQLQQMDIPSIDLVIVDLYPFEQTVASGATEEEIIEKIDIGGISLIRAAAKNHNDVVILSSASHYTPFVELLNQKDGFTDPEDRKYYAAQAFNISSHYDSAIFGYFSEQTGVRSFKKSLLNGMELRYGENPHQQGHFFGDFEAAFMQLSGKAISYNNLLDIDAAANLIDEFDEPAFAILKHNNACGVACRSVLKDAWQAALEGDPVSAFGGVLITNRSLDMETAEEINKLFFEVLIAPAYENNVTELLMQRKNRILLQRKSVKNTELTFKSVLNGVLVQDKDMRREGPEDMRPVTAKAPEIHELSDLAFANILVKHTRSNAMVLAKNKQLLGSGCGQTSRVDALQQAIAKAKHFEKDLRGAVLASDAFFPFADNVEIAHKAGITAIVQPGGSVRDEDSINYCNEHGLAMVFTGIRHFKH